MAAAGVEGPALSVDSFLHVCPLLIVQLDADVCADGRVDDDSTHHSDDHDDEMPSWLSSTAAGMYLRFLVHLTYCLF